MSDRPLRQQVVAALAAVREARESGDKGTIIGAEVRFDALLERWMDKYRHRD